MLVAKPGQLCRRSVRDYAFGLTGEAVAVPVVGTAFGPERRGEIE